MSWLVDFFKSFWNAFKSFFYWIFDSLILVIGWILYTIYDGFLIVVLTFFSILDFSSIAFNTAAQWSSMPTQLIWLVNQLAIPQGFALVASALVIRMTLNIIPASITRV